MMSRIVYYPNRQDLERLLATASATAVVLLEDGALREAAGDLTPDGFQMVANTLRRYWPAPRHPELNRTVGLALNNQYHFLFAKHTPDGMGLLGLVFPLQTPLIRLRQDMTNFMRVILENQPAPPGEDARLERSLQFILQSNPEPDLRERPSAPPEGWQMEITNADDLLEEPPVSKETSHQSGDRNTFPAAPDPQPSIRRQPAPEDTARNIPDTEASSVLWHPLNTLDWQTPTQEPTGEESAADQGHPSNWQPLEEVRQHEDDLVSIFQAGFNLQEPPTTAADWRSPAGEVRQPGSRQPEQALEEDTRPLAVEPKQTSEQLTVSDVTFYLVPRQDSHFLVGDLAQWLRRWLPALCDTYGWQLDFLSVRPDYVKWTLRDFPETLIREMLQIVRQRTSDRIFRVFPNMRSAPQIEDFWAPGYLVDTQNRDFSTRSLMTHVAAGGRIASDDDN